MNDEFIALIDPESEPRRRNALAPVWPLPNELWTDGRMIVLGGTDAPGFRKWTKRQESQISDEDAATMTHVARGAVFVPEGVEWDGRT